MDRIAELIDPAKAKVLHEGQPPRNENFLRKLLPGQERLLCLDEATGRVLWTQQWDCPYTTVATYAIGPRATPTVDGDRVYALGAEGHLFCFAAKDGAIVWQKDFKKAYNLKIPEWGTAAHPLVDGDRLICVVGGAGTTCVAFDKRTGKELWRALTGRQPGYCPPVIHTFGGLRQLIIWHSDAVEALNPQTGKVYWSVPLRPTFGMSIGQPVAAGNRLFVMSFNRVSACIEVAADGQSAQIAWRGNTRRGAGACITPPFWPMAISTPVATAATSSARVWLMENASGAPSHQPPANDRRVGPMCLLSGKVTDIFSRTILAS